MSLKIAAGELHVRGEPEEKVLLAGAVLSGAPADGPRCFKLVARKAAAVGKRGKSKTEDYVRTFGARDAQQKCLWVALVAAAADQPAATDVPSAGGGGGGGGGVAADTAAAAATGIGQAARSGAAAAAGGRRAAADLPDWMTSAVAADAFAFIEACVRAVPVAGVIFTMLGGVIRVCVTMGKNNAECTSIAMRLQGLALSVTELTAHVDTAQVNAAKAVMDVTCKKLETMVKKYLEKGTLGRLAELSFKEKTDILLAKLHEDRAMLHGLAIGNTAADVEKLKAQVDALFKMEPGHAAATPPPPPSSSSSSSAAAGAPEAAGRKAFLDFVDRKFAIVSELRAEGHPHAVFVASLGEDVKEMSAVLADAKDKRNVRRGAGVAAQRADGGAVQDLQRIANANHSLALMKHTASTAVCYEDVRAEKAVMEKNFKEWCGEAVSFGRATAAVPMPASFTYKPADVTAAPFTVGQKELWERRCIKLAGFEGKLAEATAHVVLPDPEPELDHFRERVSTYEAKHAEARACGVERPFHAVRPPTCPRAQAEEKFRSAFTAMGTALLKMELPERRLRSLDEHAWQLPSVVSNFADELQAEVTHVKLHQEHGRDEWMSCVALRGCGAARR